MTQKIFTTQFYLLCLSSFFFFLSFNMILPELMIYIKELGGESHAGWVIALFTLTAFLSRPISGKLADTWGRIPVMVFGAVVAIVASICYIFVEDVAISINHLLSPVFIFLCIRFFHGMSTGFKPTGTSAYLADIVPVDRRGEALGWLGFASSFGMALGPSIGNWLHLSYSYTVMFVVSSFTAFLSVLVLSGMKETLPEKQKTGFQWQLFKIKKDDFIEPLVKIPTLTFFLYAFAFGAIYTLIPYKMQHLQWDEYRGSFFSVYVGFTLFTRIIAGKLSDKKGREPVLLVGLFFIILALLTLGFSGSLLTLFLGAVFFGLAHGIVGPTLVAWTTDMSLVEKRGRAFSTMYMGMELGIGGGALLSAQIYNQNPDNFLWAFLVMASLATIALILVIAFYQKKKTTR